MEKYTIYCTTEQTKKAIKLGAPIIDNGKNPNVPVMLYNRNGYDVPTAEQMIGFLRKKGIKFHFDDETDYWRIDCSMLPLSDAYGVSEQKELAAIDAALDYLINIKEKEK